MYKYIFSFLFILTYNFKFMRGEILQKTTPQKKLREKVKKLNILIHKMRVNISEAMNAETEKEKEENG